LLFMLSCIFSMESSCVSVSIIFFVCIERGAFYQHDQSIPIKH
jgi:hypothetical protein